MPKVPMNKPLTAAGSARPKEPRLYNLASWRSSASAFLAENPLCVMCLKGQPPRHTPATCVDHRVPHRGNRQLFHDRRNWQSLCHACHSRKTAAEDGGFGS